MIPVLDATHFHARRHSYGSSIPVMLSAAIYALRTTYHTVDSSASPLPPPPAQTGQAVLAVYTPLIERAPCLSLYDWNGTYEYVRSRRLKHCHPIVLLVLKQTFISGCATTCHKREGVLLISGRRTGFRARIERRHSPNDISVK